MKKKMMKNGMLRQAAGVLALMIALTGCGSTKDSAAADNGAMEYKMAAAEGAYETTALYDVAEAPEEYWEEDYEAAKGSDVQTPQDTSRKLITTVRISAETEEMDALLAHIENKVAALGGYIEASDVSNGSYKTYSDRTRRYRSASLTIRIPAENLSGFVSDVQERTNITNKSQNIEDVTLSYTDLESHKRMLKAEEDRLLKFMEQAETIEDMIAVESRLTDVQYQLDSLESQLRTYDNRINYSTVYLSVEEVVEFTVTEEPKSIWDEIGTGFMDSVDSVGEGLRNFFVWFVTHIPQLLIWAVVIVLIIKVVQMIRRRRLKKLAAAAENGEGRPLTPKEEQRLARLNAKQAKKDAKKDVQETPGTSQDGLG